MTQYAIKNDVLVYRKTSRKVPNQSEYRIKENRVYKGGRLKGYIGQVKAQRVPKSQRRTFEVTEEKGLRFADTGRKPSAKYQLVLGKGKGLYRKFYVANKSGKIVGKLKTNYDFVKTLDLFYGLDDKYWSQKEYDDSYDTPEITLPATELHKPAGFTEIGLDPFFSDYKQVLETLGPTIGPASQVLGPGVISVEQRSYVNFASALDSAVTAGFITEEKAAEWFKWYSYADDKQKAILWDELYDYYEDEGFDYFD